jgi:hypothetical protein
MYIILGMLRNSKSFWCCNRPAFKFDDNNQAKVSDPLPNGFQCPGGKLGVHPALPHPTSCRLYYVCLNGVTPNEAGCTSGVVFNERTGKCDDPANVPGCENTYEKKVRQIEIWNNYNIVGSNVSVLH